MSVKILLVNGKSYHFDDSEVISVVHIKHNTIVTVKHTLDCIPCISSYYFPVDSIEAYSEIGDNPFLFDELTDDPNLEY